MLPKIIFEWNLTQVIKMTGYLYVLFDIYLKIFTGYTS